MSRTDFLLWDHDGVLVDTERWYYQATRDVLEEFAVGLDEERYLAAMARGKGSWDRLREAGASEDDVRRARDRRNDRYQEYLRTRDIDIPGVAEVLAAVKTNRRMAIVTTARRADFEVIHRDRDLLRYFEFVLTVEDYPRSKPRPDPYRAALERFGAGPERALAIEDSSRGLASAVAAGLDCLVVRSGFTESMDFSAAWKIVPRIQDVPAALAERDGTSG